MGDRKAVVTRGWVLTFVDSGSTKRARVSQMDDVVREAEEQESAEICVVVDKLQWL